MTLTQIEFDEQDFEVAKEIARRLGRKDNWAYTSTSALMGFDCPKRYSNDTGMSIIKTKELGFMVVSTLEDINMHDIYTEEIKRYKKH